MRMPRPRHSTLVAYAALFFALGGTAVAATGGSFILGHANKAGQPTALKNTGYGPALQLANGHAGSAPFTVGGNKHIVPGLNANYLGGHPASDFVRAGTLQSGKSESGMFSAAEGSATGSGGWIGAGITYPKPLAHAIENANIVDVQGVGPVPNCLAPDEPRRASSACTTRSTVAWLRAMDTPAALNSAARPWVRFSTGR